LTDLLFTISAGCIYLILYVLTYFVDPDPSKSVREGLGSYRLNELRILGRKGLDLTADYFKGIAKWTFQILP
jgi:hypothetical protein